MGGRNRARGVVRLEGPKGPEEGSKVAQNTLNSTDSFRILKCAGMAVVGAFAGAVMQWSRGGLRLSLQCAASAGPAYAALLRALAETMLVANGYQYLKVLITELPQARTVEDFEAMLPWRLALT